MNLNIMGFVQLQEFNVTSAVIALFYMIRRNVFNWFSRRMMKCLEVSEEAYPTLLTSLGRGLSYPNLPYEMFHTDRQTHRHTDTHLHYYYLELLLLLLLAVLRANARGRS